MGLAALRIVDRRRQVLHLRESSTRQASRLEHHATKPSVGDSPVVGAREQQATVDDDRHRGGCKLRIVVLGDESGPLRRRVAWRVQDHHIETFASPLRLPEPREHIADDQNMSPGPVRADVFEIRPAALDRRRGDVDAHRPACPTERSAHGKRTRVREQVGD
jgi:hypothetical protein